MRRFYCTASDVRKYVYSPKVWLSDFFNPRKPNYYGIKRHAALSNPSLNFIESEKIKSFFPSQKKVFGNTRTYYNDEYKLKGKPDGFLDGIPVEVKFRDKIFECDRFQAAVYCLLVGKEKALLANLNGVEVVQVEKYKDKIIEIAKKIFLFKRVAKWCGFR
jgi:hypothetical protein